MALPKEDLRNFQTRFAERIRVANEQDVAASWLAVMVKGFNCLFPLSQAKEVLPAVPITPVPYVKPWFMGTINSRGRVYGVVDLTEYLTLEYKQEYSFAGRLNALAECSMIGINVELNLNCMLIVNKVLGLRTLQNFEKSAPPLSDAPNYFGLLYRDVAGVDWQEISLQNLSRSPGFLSISV